MYVLHISPLGRVVIYLSTIIISGFNIYMTGYDEDHNRVDFVMDKISYPDENPEGCGYCHILSYTMHGVTVPCNTYKSIH